MQQMVFPDFTATIIVSRAVFEGRWRKKIILESGPNPLKLTPFLPNFHSNFPLV
jgi:hypothetical protein